MRRKWIIRVVAGLVAALVVVFVALAFSLGAIVKKGVETIGPRAARVDVKLKGAEVWLLAGRAQLTGFVLGNPPGCNTPSAIAVDSARLPAPVRDSPRALPSISVETVATSASAAAMGGPCLAPPRPGRRLRSSPRSFCHRMRR